MTLVELLVTACLVAAALGPMAAILRSSATLSNTLTKQGEMQERSRRVVDAMAREIRWADSSTLVVTTLNGSTKLTLKTATGYVGGVVVWSPTITYQVNASNVDSNHDGALNEFCLVRIQNGRTTILCNDVPAGGFSAVLTDSNLRIGLQLTAADMQRRAVTTSATAAVTLRNQSL